MTSCRPNSPSAKNKYLNLNKINESNFIPKFCNSMNIENMDILGDYHKPFLPYDLTPSFPLTIEDHLDQYLRTILAT